MTVVEAAGLNQLVHIVDGEHRMRAQIAMALTQSGGHPQIYEDIEELLEARPSGGTILASTSTSSVADLMARLQAGEIFLPLIIFAEDPKPSQIVRAAHEGAADYLAWPFTGEELLSSCAYCQQFMHESGGSIVRRHKARKLIEGLSRREVQILAFLLDGHSNKSIANSLDISPRTVEDYRLNAMKKLGVSATSAAIRIGLEAGLDGAWTTPLAPSPFSSAELS
jgi:two-component system response regulator FixJ